MIDQENNILFILQHTCIRAGDDDDLSGQIRDVL